MFKEYANNFSVVKMHLIVQFVIVITGNIQIMKPVQKYTHICRPIFITLQFLKLRFNEDLRVQEVRRLLQSSRPAKIALTQRPEVRYLCSK